MFRVCVNKNKKLLIVCAHSTWNQRERKTVYLLLNNAYVHQKGITRRIAIIYHCSGIISGKNIAETRTLPGWDSTQRVYRQLGRPVLLSLRLNDKSASWPRLSSPLAALRSKISMKIVIKATTPERTILLRLTWRYESTVWRMLIGVSCFSAASSNRCGNLSKWRVW